MYDAFSRMENLLGTKGVKRLGSAKIAVFGIGGIGSYVVEALARCGVGSLTLVDHEDISLTDINRQLYALRSATDFMLQQVLQISSLQQAANRSSKVHLVFQEQVLFIKT